MKRLWVGASFFASCTLLVACGSSNGTNTPPSPPPTPPAAQIAIQSPSSGAVVTTLPVTLSVSFVNGADPSSMKALLDGVDISAQFSAPDSNGVRQAQVNRPAVNLGKNQLQVTSGTLMSSVAFTVSLDLLGASASTLPLLVPIRTRVLNNGTGTKATDFNVAVYEDANNPTNATLIQAPALADSSNTGFQVVYLRRADLSLIANISVPNPDQASDKSLNALSPISQALIPPAGCGAVGCNVVVQSLGSIGYAPCTAQHFYDCVFWTSLFEGLGGSGRIGYVFGDNNPIVAYSLVGNSISQGPINQPVAAGTYYESLTCSGNNYGNNGVMCDSLGYPNTSYTAPNNATPDQIGYISGALVRDNFNNFTYAQNALPASFSTTTNKSTLVNTITVNGVPYMSGNLGGSLGGFHLLVLNRTTLAVEQENTFPSSQNGDASEVTALVNAIKGYASYGNLFIICAFGNTTYNGTSRSAWYAASQFMGSIGGTQQVFYLMNNPETQPVNLDVYTLVGFFVDPMGRNELPMTTGLETLVGAEMSSVIARENEAYPHSSGMEGILKLDHQGFYSPTSFGHKRGLAKVAVTDALGSSLLNPTPWPFPGPDMNRSQAAYVWISQQLCCDDIRSAYVNLNASPDLWLTDLNSLSFNAASLPNSDAADFNAMKAQLQLEFQYLSSIRLFQSNVTGLYQDQQTNVSLLLQEASNDIIANLKLDLNTPSQSPGWISVVDDLFGIDEGIAGAFTDDETDLGTPVGTALAVGTLLLDQVADYTTTPAGSSLQAEENVEITVGQMASTAANDYAQSLVSLGSEFDRVVTDWGRLKTLGAPLLDNQLPWDANVSGIMLQGYDTRVTREFYLKLLKVNSSIQIVPYTNDHLSIGQTFGTDGNDCDWPSFVQQNPQLLYYPNGMPNADHKDPHGTAYPYDYQWGMWTLIFSMYQSDECPGNNHPFPATYGLFEPLDPGNPQQLGMYRLWFYTRENYPSSVNTSQTPCYDGSC
jgi:hypothetical protein